MKRIPTNLPGVYILEPKVFGDRRGFFMESYNRRTFSDIGIDCDFCQDNHSRSTGGVLRGLHFQLGRPQAKLVRVIRGRVFDVAVDIRRGSPTFGQWTAVELSEENQRMFFVPRGFAHGFYVTSEEAEFFYKCDDYYVPEEERGVIWNDPGIGIEWPAECVDPVLSAKDSAYGPLSALEDADLPDYEQFS
jgi:dTDP-4-dehydrorhamnose 3,5-epimerase